MKTIWKYELPITDSRTIEMQKGAEILTVQTQNEMPCIWALVDPKESKEKRTFVIYGTGHNFGLIDYKYIGTFHMHGGTLVFHLFEIAL